MLVVFSGKENFDLYATLLGGGCLTMVTLWHGPAQLLHSEERSFNPCRSAVFLTRMHLSWSGLIILCSRRSHSTAAALLHGGSTSAAIIGRGAWVAQLTMLIPELCGTI